VGKITIKMVLPQIICHHLILRL